jgi:pentatricopeptide repeat protein
MGIHAIELYYQMPAVFIHEATDVCVLNACSHSGLVDEARSIFKNIQIKTEKISTAMVCRTSGFF